MSNYNALMPPFEKVESVKRHAGRTIDEILSKESLFDVFAILGAIDILVGYKVCNSMRTTSAERMVFAFAWLARDEAERDAIHPAGDDSHVQNPGGLEVEHRRYIGVGEIDIAADQRLRGYRPAIEINRLDVEIVFGPETGLVDGIIETLGHTRAAVTHLERWLRMRAARACHRYHNDD